MTIGADSITAFIGVGGPYWTDLDGDHEVSWTDAAGNPLTAAVADTNNNTLVDTNETAELDDDAVGFHITDLDVGIAVMASFDIGNLGVYLAGKLNVHSFGLVGIDGLTAEGAFDIALNVGFGLSGLEPNLDVIDFDASFNETYALFDLFDTAGTDGITPAELTAAFGAGHGVTTPLTTTRELIALLDASLPVAAVTGQLTSGFSTSHLAAILAADADADGYFGLGERQALFNVFDVNSAGGITLDELSAALGAGHGSPDPLATAQQLIDLLASRALSVAEVTGQLTSGFSTSHLTAILAADANSDGYFGLTERQALFNVFDVNGAGGITLAELNAALRTAQSLGPLTTAQQLVDLLNVGGAPPDRILFVTEVVEQLNDALSEAQLAALVDQIRAADADGDGKLDIGFEVNTGNPAAPAILDFDDFLISIRLGGEIELEDVFRLYGVFLFEADTSGLKAFVAAGLEVGPDIGSTSKIFSMNALGALVINADGVAADIDVSISIGGALSDFLQLNAHARLVFNTTGDDLEIEIPAQYVAYLLGNVPASEDYDSSLVSGLTLTQDEVDERFDIDPDTGAATFTISGTAPGETVAGFYLLATFDADLTILRAFVIDASFRLLLTDQKFELSFTGSLALSGFGSFTVAGGAVIDDNGFAAYGSLTIDIDLGGLGVVEIGGTAELMINTSTTESADIIIGLDTHTIDPSTFKVAVAAHVTPVWSCRSDRGCRDRVGKRRVRNRRE